MDFVLSGFASCRFNRILPCKLEAWERNVAIDRFVRGVGWYRGQGDDDGVEVPPMVHHVERNTYEVPYIYQAPLRDVCDVKSRG